ncbi:hypothetical protein HHK36_025492 [Tetracentron sinense]|uniref:Late embryogenesis abundant protein LEA-2 subgroup domain-containing protein n=1 Tax=Tetracentron sinense TaxID=13715 RepID=A0A834YHN7_TETSI|nr:hypothetical protein HHK36_025492 [Tetracentron sinense]
MTDRIHPSAKPTSNPPQTINGSNTNTNPSLPSSKPQQYGAPRPSYRPRPKPRRNRRSCCCVCFLWTTLLILALLLLTAIAGAVVWVLYRPQRPSFSITTLQISQFNITTSTDSSSHLNSKLDLTISAQNRNKKLVFLYDPFTVSVNSNDVEVGNGSFPSFVHGTKNTTIIEASVSSVAQDLDTASVTSLKSDLNKNGGLPLKIKLDTKVKVKMGGLKSNKIGIRVSCDGIQSAVPKGKTPTTTEYSKRKCKVDLRIKIWKWTF